MAVVVPSNRRDRVVALISACTVLFFMITPCSNVSHCGHSVAPGPSGLRTDDCPRLRFFTNGDTTADGLLLGASVDRRVRMNMRRYGRGLALRGTSCVKVKYSRSPVASNAQLAVWEWHTNRNSRSSRRANS